MNRINVRSYLAVPENAAHARRVFEQPHNSGIEEIMNNLYCFPRGKEYLDRCLPKRDFTTHPVTVQEAWAFQQWMEWMVREYWDEHPEWSAEEDARVYAETGRRRDAIKH